MLVEDSQKRGGRPTSGTIRHPEPSVVTEFVAAAIRSVHTTGPQEVQCYPGYFHDPAHGGQCWA